ncbi:MAG: phosphoenolpyruvate-protein phosphotransferase system enzyme [Thermodesulfobacteriota bacterium]|nr:phosphoenolpyruvate-protein phosphotransferase system enzyme [Thermodesulfobacteriota bacterium]
MMVSDPKRYENFFFKGVGVSGGVGIGQAVIIKHLTTDLCPKRIITPDEIPHEIQRFEDAVKSAEQRLREIRNGLDTSHPLFDHAYILETHILLLHDRMFFEGTKTAISNELLNAEWALAQIMMNVTAAFDSIEDEYLKERARDIHFVGERVLKLLMGIQSAGMVTQLPPHSVIVAHDLSPADTAQIKKDNVFGFATDMGGKTSHTAIMARSIKIPAVTGLEKISNIVQTGDTIVIDGSTGVVIVNPDPETIYRYRERQEVYRKYQQSLMAFGMLPAVTSDGSRSVRITANIELIDEISIAVSHGAEGVGLFRTEYLFLGRSDLPSEEEQYAIYKRVLEYNNPNPVTIRTLDIGGDKMSAQIGASHEANPALGLRAIRLCLSRVDLFKTQLRAILRAAVHGTCRLLIPMVSCIKELLATKEIISQAAQELDSQGIPHQSRIKLGILVEVPSAVVIADLLAREVDFFSIGTNDLIQYAMAIDRVNEQVNYLYDTLHPAVLRLIRQTTMAAQARGIEVAMCGEMAGDPVNIPILLGLGIDELSMNALAIPLVKKLVRSVTMEECADLTRQAFEMQDSEEIRFFLEDWLGARFPRDYFVDSSQHVQ